MEKTSLCRYGSLLFFASAVTGVISFSCQSKTKNSEPKPPNVIFILADDLGWSQTGAYGSEFYETPNIDRLAREGIRFTQAYSAAAVCSPTRASIMTGKYPARIGLTDFIAGNQRDNYVLSQPDWQKFLPLDEYTLGELFRDNGYATAIFGKWHLSKNKRPPESLSHNPDKQGFHEYFVTYKPDGSTDPEGDPHNSDTITALSLDFLERKKDTSFFLFMSFNAIHDPLVESEDRIESFKDSPETDEPENHPVVAAMLKRMDTNIGKVLTRVEELNLEENTFIVFYSDNGGKEFYADQAPFRKGKGWLYEGGIRVPLIIKWKGRVPDNKVSDEMVISNDFFPTFSDLLNTDSLISHDGVSLLPHLLEQKPVPDRALFWYYPHYHFGSGMLPASAMRSGRYKMIEWHEGNLTGKKDFLELYDLTDDPAESVNLVDSLRVLRDSLYGELLNWRRNVGAKMPVINVLDE